MKQFFKTWNNYFVLEYEKFNHINAPMSLSLITDQEKSFVEQYAIRLKELQSNEKQDYIVYTKLSMAYALQHRLHYVELAFHPFSIKRRKYYEKEETKDVKELLENIIISETTSDVSLISQYQLELIISHFRQLQQEEV